jgi:hypothetical protein
MCLSSRAVVLSVSKVEYLILLTFCDLGTHIQHVLPYTRVLKVYKYLANCGILPLPFHDTGRMVHTCRVCAQSVERGLQCTEFSTVIADIHSLEASCAKIEIDLHDSFNAFCFECRRITMSVPLGGSVCQQVCYLRSQVCCFEQLKSYGLVLKQTLCNEMM